MSSDKNVKKFKKPRDLIHLTGISLELSSTPQRTRIIIIVRNEAVRANTSEKELWKKEREERKETTTVVATQA